MSHAGLLHLNVKCLTNWSSHCNSLFQRYSFSPSFPRYFTTGQTLSSRSNSSRDRINRSNWPQNGISAPRKLRTRFQASPALIKRLFGDTPIAPQTASAIIHELHKRRITGSLVDHGTSFPTTTSTPAITPAHTSAVLTWLRATYPIDEAAAATYYAARAIAAHEDAQRARLTDRAARWGLIERAPRTTTSRRHHHHAEATPIEQDSVIQEAVDRWKRAREAREAAAHAAGHSEQQERVRRRQEHALQVAKEQEMLDERREEKLKRWDELAAAAEVDTAEIMDEQRSAWSRLARPTAFAVVAAAALAGLFLPGVSVSVDALGVAEANRSAIITCSTLTAVHVALLMAWRVPRLMWYMNRYFVLLAGAPRAFSILGATMSHQFIYWHLATNTAFLFLGGMQLHEEIGRWRFIAIYFISGVFGNVISLYWNVLRANFVHASCGASGALFGVLGAYFTSKEERVITVPFSEQTLTYNSWYGVGVMMITLLFEIRRKNVDHLVHSGGFAMGVILGWLCRTLGISTDTEKKQQEIGKVAS